MSEAKPIALDKYLKNIPYDVDTQVKAIVTRHTRPSLSKKIFAYALNTQITLSYNGDEQTFKSHNIYDFQKITPGVEVNATVSATKMQYEKILAWAYRKLTKSKNKRDAFFFLKDIKPLK